MAETQADIDAHWMRRALSAAERAGERGEVPVGAVVVYDGEEIVAAGNATIGACDPTAHAEIVALRSAAEAVGNHRLVGATMYVTLEPCAMCVGALVQARIDRVVFGAADPKAGALGSVFDLNCGRLNHRFAVTSGVLADETASLLQTFFRSRRSAVSVVGDDTSLAF
ncbi:MAG TPA: tRNA adenosine(34) deaminase TadA [Candidatus Binatia bacterium]|nr:tRNA adenosine(34) deaminase TadA [Candidatus Binatia bacterium]